MASKLSKVERLVDEQMLALLEWTSDHPKRWQSPPIWTQAALI